MEFIGRVNQYIINPLIIFLFALAVIYFLFGLMKFIQNQDNSEEQASGKRHMVWGVIGIFIMLSVYGILGIIIDTVDTLTGDM